MSDAENIRENKIFTFMTNRAILEEQSFMTVYSNVNPDDLFASENCFVVMYSDILKSICSMEISEDSNESLFHFVSPLFPNNVVTNSARKISECIMFASLCNPDISMRMLSMDDLPFVSKREMNGIQPEMDFSGWVREADVLEPGVTLKNMSVGKLACLYTVYDGYAKKDKDRKAAIIREDRLQMMPENIKNFVEKSMEKKI